MSKVTFVAPKKVTEKDEDGNDIITTVAWTREELLSMVRDNDPALFAVTLSHATQVIRPQRNYQEVFEDIIVDGARPVEVSTEGSSANKVDPVANDKYASKSEARRATAQAKVSGKPVRTQRVGNSDGSNDAPRT